MPQHFINLTNHIVRVKIADNAMLSIFPSGKVARVYTEPLARKPVNGIKVVKHATVSLDLPKPTRGLAFIVSGTVAQYYPDRTDLYVPGGLIHDDSNGEVIACKYLVNNYIP